MSDEVELRAPEPLAATHDLTCLDSGEATLDEWLRRRVMANQKLGATRSYVACPAGGRVVVGYYALAMGGILAQETPTSVRRNMPRVIPAVMLGRLAVDRAAQGRGLGARLLRDAVERALRVSTEISARLVVVHALTPAAEAFYLRHGFAKLPLEAPTLALDLLKYAKA